MPASAGCGLRFHEAEVVQRRDCGTTRRTMRRGCAARRVFNCIRAESSGRRDQEAFNVAPSVLNRATE